MPILPYSRLLYSVVAIVLALHILTALAPAAADPLVGQWRYPDGAVIGNRS
jgi:hypothetical protein